jgi:hypothetical protein
MLFCTTWKARPITVDQTDRMMGIWGKIEADMAARTDMTRQCWYVAADGSQGLLVVDTNDPAAAAAFNLEVSLALGEFLEFDTRPVLDLDAAMPAIAAAVERTKA